MYKILNTDVRELTINLPSSKSLTHRAYILSAVTGKESLVRNPLESEDTLITKNILSDWGLIFEETGEGVKISGSISRRGEETIYLANSGSTARFLLPLASYLNKPVRFTGDEEIYRRPFKSLFEAIRDLSGTIEAGDNSLPATVYPAKLSGGELIFENLSSSQIISGLMMAAPLMEKELQLKIPVDTPSLAYVKMTFDFMRKTGFRIFMEDRKINIFPKIPEKGLDIEIEKDLSAAAIWVALALVSGIHIDFPGVSLKSIQGDRIIFDIAEAVGAKVREYPGGVEVSGRINKSMDLDCRNVPDLVPALSVAALFAPGQSVFRNVNHLKHKESDRIRSISENINLIGGKAEFDNNNMLITPSDKYSGGKIRCYNDHRIAMSFAMAGAVIENILIDQPEAVKKSYPDFWEHFTFYSTYRDN